MTWLYTCQNMLKTFLSADNSVRKLLRGSHVHVRAASVCICICIYLGTHILVLQVFGLGLYLIGLQWTSLLSVFNALQFPVESNWTELNPKQPRLSSELKGDWFLVSIYSDWIQTASCGLTVEQCNSILHPFQPPREQFCSCYGCASLLLLHFYIL